MWILILLGRLPDEHPYYPSLGTLALPLEEICVWS